MPSTGEAAANRTPDAIDRMKELLRSAIDAVEHQTRIVNNAMDRALGTIPTPPASEKIGLVPPSPSFEHTSLSWMFGDLERAHRDLANVIARLREQQV